MIFEVMSIPTHNFSLRMKLYNAEERHLDILDVKLALASRYARSSGACGHFATVTGRSQVTYAS